MENTSPDRRLAAIVAIDVVDYSRLMGADEEGTLARLKAHRDAMRPTVTEHGGRLVGQAGDGLLFEFPSVIEAVACTVKVQAAMQERNSDIPDEIKMLFRAGINVGDVMVDGDDIFGDGVNVAARIEQLAPAGGICLSRSVRNQVRDKMPINLEDMGEIEVKNIARPIRVFRVLKEGEVAAPRSKIRPAWQKYTAIAAVAVALVVGGAGWWWSQQPDFEPADPKKLAYGLPDKPSIAVLPFDYLGSEKEENDYLADGLTENIIAALAQIPELFVIARNSSFTLKGKATDVREVSEKFGVRYILEGSIQVSGDTMRVTAQLVDGLDGKHIWAETFDRPISDIFKTQDEITKKIAVAMQVNIAETPEAPWRSRGTTNLKAWALTTQAITEFQKHTFDGAQKADELSGQAVELDKNYAQAWAMRAYVRSTQTRFAKGEERAKMIQSGLEFADRAIQLDPTNPLGFLTKAMLQQFNQKFDEAIQLGLKAISLAPSLPESHAVLSMIYRFVGEYDRAVEELELAQRLHPEHPTWYYLVQGNNLAFAGRYKEVVDFWSLHRQIVTEPNMISPEINLAIAYGAMGKADLSRQMVDIIKSVWPDVTIAKIRGLFPIKDKALLAERMSWLVKAGVPETTAPTSPVKPSIAVLPFANLSDDKDQEYFADGMTDDLITDLSKISGLDVIARNSVFSYKGKNVKVQEVARDLNVSHVLEGSVRRAGDKIRINAQLIDAATGGHLWAETFDRDVGSIFQTQDEIIGKIVEELQINLTVGEQGRLFRKSTTSAEAYQLLLRARARFFFHQRAENAKAQALCDQAILIDPEFALAYVMRGWTYYDQFLNGWTTDPAAAYGHAVADAKKALEINSNAKGAHALLGWINLFQGKTDDAISSAKKAVSLEPSGADVLSIYAWILVLSGHANDAIPWFHRSKRLDPNMALFKYGILAEAYRQLGRYEEMIPVAKKALPVHWWEHPRLVYAYMELGQEDKARAELKKMLEGYPERVQAFILGIGPLPEIARERYLEVLQKVGFPKQLK